MVILCIYSSAIKIVKQNKTKGVCEGLGVGGYPVNYALKYY